MSALPHRSADVLSVPRLVVDLAAVADNTRTLAGRTDAQLMAVVKADAFGHGAVPVARTALAHGATWLGVTSVAEGAQLRAAGIVAPVLSWLNAPSADFGAAVARSIDIAVPSRTHLDALAWAASAARARARVHLHLDVGMARDGAGDREWSSLCGQARWLERRGLVDVVGVMGHLPQADRPGDPSTVDGLRRFHVGVEVARSCGLQPVVRHLAATAALLHEASTHLDLCRAGAGLFGIDPSGRAGLRPALTVTAPVVTVRDVSAGTPVGYGHTWVSSSATRLVLLPVGYADGLPRTASGRAEVTLAGRRCPVVGTISMDQVVVDVGDLPVTPGDTAVVLGPGGPSVAEWASWAGTIEHEVLTGLGSRLERVAVPDRTPTLRGLR